MRCLHLTCVVCGKVFESEYKRKTCSTICRYKSASITSKSSIKMRERNHSETWLSKVRTSNLGNHYTKEKHSKAIREEILKMENLGYECINLDKVQPDFLAITKDGQIIACEVEFGRPNYAKYEDAPFYDDIIWIKRSKKS
jgi:hypothetical protein